uniref:Ig-like domain-containing protein n=1 Tax=Gasterosteus aculeatus aculeatus TaxID=481459 RepID=G3QA99_GASAC
MCPTLRLLVLISIAGFVEPISVSTPQKHVNVTMGESALLQCTFESTDQTAGLTIQWDFVSPPSMTPQQVFYYQKGENVIPSPYKGRVRPPQSPGPTKNASITISNMQPSDAGVYTCQIHNFPDVVGQSEANVVVNVLEKPTTPYCAVHGDVESGHLVTLTCHSERGSPNPIYTWIRLDQTKTRRPVLGREAKDGVIAGAVIGAMLGCVLIILVVWFVAHTLKKHKYNRVKKSEANEMKRSSPQAQEAPDSVTLATPAGNLHAERDEPQA